MPIIHVSQNHPKASDLNIGREDSPLKTVQAAARRAQPGDVVLIHSGTYRERVSPALGGEEVKPILYKAAQKGAVFLKGSDLIETVWFPHPKLPRVCCLPLSVLRIGAEAYAGVCDPERYGAFNPYTLQYARKNSARPHTKSLAELELKIENFRKKITETDGSGTEKTNWEQKLHALEQEMSQRKDPKDPRHFTTLGQLFYEGAQLFECERISELTLLQGSWLVSPQGNEIWAHFPDRPGAEALRRVELSTRHTVFSPLTRGLGHIHIEDLIIEHGASYFPSWGQTGWAQAGLLSTRGGHHWRISGCTIRHAKFIGIDCGSEGGEENAECGPPFQNVGSDHGGMRNTKAGYHTIENNDISDNGHCGICGIGHRQTKLRFNRIERNSSLGLTAPWWEFAGVKFHHCYGALIEGNIVRDNEAHGIWLDNQFQGTRVTRNLIVNNLWSGVNLEYGRGPCLVDNNVIALTRQGDGIYGHDCAEVTIAHNLLYGNAGFGVWLAYCTNRVPLADACSDHRILNNMILANKIGAVSLPLDWAGAKNNRSDCNLLMGSGQTLDEGSGPFEPLFQINNKSHCAQFAHICPGPEVQSSENVIRNLQNAMQSAGVPPQLQPTAVMLERGFLIPLEVWQKVCGRDKNTRVIRAVRDGLSTRQPTFTFHFDGSERSVPCEVVAGVERDYFGSPIHQSPLPGPFQSLPEGAVRIPLTPVIFYDK